MGAFVFKKVDSFFELKISGTFMFLSINFMIVDEYLVSWCNISV